MRPSTPRASGEVCRTIMLYIKYLHCKRYHVLRHTITRIRVAERLSVQSDTIRTGQAQVRIHLNTALIDGVAKGGGYMGIIIPPPSAQCGDTHLTYRIEQPKRIRVGGIKHVTPQLVVQHATTRLTVPVPTHGSRGFAAAQPMFETCCCSQLRR